MTSETTTPPSTVFRAAGDLRLLTWPALDVSGADAVVAARTGGVSSGPYESLNLSFTVGDDPGCVLENRHRLATAFGADLGDFVFARQVHGDRARVVTESGRGSGAFRLDDAIDGIDALVTASPEVVLAILTADCVPIVLHDPVAGVLACVHAGWRGTVAGVCAAAVAAMESLGSRPSDILAGVGPAVAPGRYQVGADVYQAVTRAFGSAAAAFLRPHSVAEHWLLDLWAANRFALRAAGVPDDQIHVTDLPTGPIHHPDTVAPEERTRSASTQDLVSPASPNNLADPTGHGFFFSDRAARPCGRLALVARLRTPGQNPWL